MSVSSQGLISTFQVGLALILSFEVGLLILQHYILCVTWLVCVLWWILWFDVPVDSWVIHWVVLSDFTFLEFATEFLFGLFERFSGLMLPWILGLYICC